MSKFNKLRKNLRLDRYKAHSSSGHEASYLKNTIPPDTKPFSHNNVKPFLVDLLRSNKPFKKNRNSQFFRLDEQSHSEYSLEEKHNPFELKTAILEKSDKLALSLVRTIGVLEQEINSLKEMISQKDSKNLPKCFDIDLLTDQFVAVLENIGIIPKFTSPSFIYILDNPKEMNIVLETVKMMSKTSVKGGLRAVGLDVETASRNHYSSFPSILQIAINKNIVIIFQVFF